MNEQEQKEFNELASPVMKWLNENKHPHVKVIITPTSAELVEGEYSTGRVLDYVRH